MVAGSCFGTGVVRPKRLLGHASGRDMALRSPNLHLLLLECRLHLDASHLHQLGNQATATVLGFNSARVRRHLRYLDFSVLVAGSRLPAVRHTANGYAFLVWNSEPDITLAGDFPERHADMACRH